MRGDQEKDLQALFQGSFLTLGRASLKLLVASHRARQSAWAVFPGVLNSCEYYQCYKHAEEAGGTCQDCDYNPTVTEEDDSGRRELERGDREVLAQRLEEEGETDMAKAVILNERVR